jgi:hypothetical protein
MENRLALCLKHLKEVEAKLIKLQSTPFGNPREDARIAEALSFVQEAVDAILESCRAVAILPESKTRMRTAGS